MTAKKAKNKRAWGGASSGAADRRGSALDRFLDWLENGDDVLNAEMEESLKDGEDASGTCASGGQQPSRRELRADEPREHQPFHRAAPPQSREKKQKTKRSIPDSKLKNTEVYKNRTDSNRFIDSIWYKIAAVAIGAALIGLMMFTVSKMPRFGGADTLVDSEVSRFYVENTLEETGAQNIVTGIILDYRGFDTLGESHVLFIAVCAVLLMLSIQGERDEKERLRQIAYEQLYEPKHDVILQSAARILTPLILVFGLYIIFNGHLSPGGGFSGGAVLGAGLILYQNAFGYKRIERFFNYKTFKWISVACLLSYSAMKGYHFFTGANQMANGISAGVAGRIFSAGLMLPLNIVVGGVVGCTMYALYTMFRRGEF